MRASPQTSPARPPRRAGRLTLRLEALEPRIMLSSSVFDAAIAADTCVFQGLPSNSFGSSDTAYAGAQGDYEWQGYFQWDVSPLTGETVESVTLRLHCSEAPATLMTPEVYELTSSWSESGVTWNTKPSYSCGVLPGN